MSVVENYRNRRVLLTGITGFKGIWLGAWLEALGADVTGLALQPQPSMSDGWPELSNRFKWISQDICDQKNVQKAVQDCEPEIIFHLAAQPLVRLSYREPITTFATNVMGTANVLEAARHTDSVKATVVVSTDKCYENVEWHWPYRESDPLGGSDPYSASKACTEIVTSSYRRSFGSQNTTTGRSNWYIGSGRAGNVIGGGDWAEDRIVPDIIRSVMKGKPVVLRQPNAVRPWQHVLEPLAGYLMLGSRLLDGDSNAAKGWNFGPYSNSFVTVKELTDLVIHFFGTGSVVVDENQPRPKEAGLLRLDSSQAIAELGWSPLLTDEERIEWTVTWYKTWQSNKLRTWSNTDCQIEQYSGLIKHSRSMSAAWYGTTIVNSERSKIAA